MNKQFTGTKNMNERVAFNRLDEIINKYKLNDTEDQLIKESIDYLKELLELKNKNHERWELIKNKLTQKQLLHIVENG